MRYDIFQRHAGLVAIRLPNPGFHFNLLKSCNNSIPSVNPLKSRLLCVLAGVASAVMVFLLFAPSPQAVEAEAAPTHHFMLIKNPACRCGIMVGCYDDCDTIEGLDCCTPGLSGSGGCLYCDP